MYNLEELKNVIGDLFRNVAGENGYKEKEVEMLLESIDFPSLLQVLRHNAESVYAFTTEGQYEKSYDYRSAELFSQRATLLYDTLDDCDSGMVMVTRSYELWLLEDMTLATVVHVNVSYDNGQYETEYREIKNGEPWEVLDLDLEELKLHLSLLCCSCYDKEIPVYEL